MGLVRSRARRVRLESGRHKKCSTRVVWLENGRAKRVSLESNGAKRAELVVWLKR